MTNKEREKLWYGVIKDISRTHGWKFKRFFIYKVVSEFFYVACFWPYNGGKFISVSIGLKPVKIDDLFWTIVDMPDNIKRPLCFRAEAAFCLRDKDILNCKVEITEELKPNEEIESLLKDLDNQVIATSQKIKNNEDFFQALLEDEKLHSSCIVTLLISNGDYLNALKKNNEYKENEMLSGFGFGSKDYFDLAKEYCLRRYC